MSDTDRDPLRASLLFREMVGVDALRNDARSRHIYEFLVRYERHHAQAHQECEREFKKAAEEGGHICGSSCPKYGAEEAMREEYATQTTPTVPATPKPKTLPATSTAGD